MDKIEYQEYLKSDHWIKISNDVKNQSDHRCRLCNSKMNLQVHHRCYLWVGNYEKEINDLVCLCETCHADFHGKRIIKILKPATHPNNILSGTQLNKSIKKKKHKWFKHLSIKKNSNFKTTIKNIKVKKKYVRREIEVIKKKDKEIFFKNYIKRNQKELKKIVMF